MRHHQLIILLCASLVGSEAAAQVPAKVHADPGFVAWLGDTVLLEERWIELPQAGLGVAYGLRPAAVGAKSGVALEDAFLLFDLKTLASIGSPLVRVAAPQDGCPGPGFVAELTVRSDGKGVAEVGYATGAQTCLVRVEKRALRLFPDPSLPIESGFPQAVQAVRSSGRFKAGPAELKWTALPRSDWLLATASEGCRVWLVDRITHQVDEARAATIEKEVCSCLDGVGLDVVVQEGSLLVACPGASCTIDPGGTPQCAPVEPTEGRGSPALLAELEEQKTNAEREAEARAQADGEAAERLLGEEAARNGLLELLKASREATLLWQYKKKDDALQVWRGLYRKYVEAGRRVEPDSFAGRWEEIHTLLGKAVELKYARVDTWAEVLNNLGFALWNAKEYRQAAVAYAECAELLKAHGRTRPVLELNWGDLERDRGRKEEARMHYERYLESKPSAAQRRRIAQELKRLQ